MIRVARLLLWLLLATLLVSSAESYVSGGSAPVAVHTGQVATRSIVPAVNNLTLQWVQTRYAQVARAYFTRVKLVFGCWYAAETAAGADCIVKAGFEYPAGTFTQVTCGASTTCTVPNGQELASDWINVPVQNGDTFYPRTLMNNSVGILLTNNIAITALGDGYECSATPLTDKTMGGTLTNTTCSGLMYVPISVVAETRKPSICFWGDSINWGIADGSQTGPRGLPRLVASVHPYISFGVNGESTTSFISNHARRVGLSNSYCTHVVNEYGLNDINAGSSAATVEANLQTIWAYFTQGPVYQTTYMPSLASASPTCPSGGPAGPLNSGQTPIANEAARTTANTFFRTTPTGIRAYFDLASVLETSTNSGKWLTDGVTCQYTTDGLHPNAAGYDLMISQNIMPTGTFTWPYLLRRDLQPPAANDNEHEPAFLDKAA